MKKIVCCLVCNWFFSKGYQKDTILMYNGIKDTAGNGVDIHEIESFNCRR